MTTVFDLADDLGPAKVIHVHVPKVGLKGILVVDNVAAGPSIGGVRMAPDVSLTECARLARAMTLKNAMAGLPHGGGKSVIFADPKMPASEKEQLIRATLMAQRGWVAVLPEENPDPQKLLNAIETALTSSRQQKTAADLNGLGRLCQVIFELLQTAGLIENMAHLKPPQKSAM